MKGAMFCGVCPRMIRRLAGAALGGDWVFAVALLAAGVLMVIQAVKARRARRRKKEARASARTLKRDLRKAVKPHSISTETLKKR